MNKKIILAMLLSAFLLSAMTATSLSQDLTVGVSVGDSFKYAGTLVLWEGDTPFPPMFLEYLQTYNESDWIEYTVTGIEAENVTFEVTTHWTNGTETVDTLEENIASTQPMMIIGADLTEGTEIRAAYTDDWGVEYAARILNASEMREYESGARETNVLIFDQDMLGINLFHYEFLFDKETGMRVYWRNNTTDSDDMFGHTYTYDCTLELIETNIADWTVIPEFPTGTVMLLIFVAVTVCVDVYRRKELKR
jgi:hypothetical protein